MGRNAEIEGFTQLSALYVLDIHINLPSRLFTYF